MIVLLLASEVDFEASRLRRAVLLPLGAALALALALLLFGSGPGSSGVKVNLLGAQPVEAIRLLVVFALAAYFGRRIELLRALSEPRDRRAPMAALRPRAAVEGRAAGVRQHGAGAAVLLFPEGPRPGAGADLRVSRALRRRRAGHGAFAITGFALLLGGFAVAYWIGEPATVRQRVMIWSDPWNNGVPGGNQIAHGLWACPPAALWGSGPGLGSPQLVPAGHTDFVLAAIGEELGFIGLAAIVLLYAILGWRCLRVAIRAPGDYTAFLAVGVALGLVRAGAGHRGRPARAGPALRRRDAVSRASADRR